MPQKVRDKNPKRELFKQQEATHVSAFFAKHAYDSNEQKTIQNLTDESIVLAGYEIYYVFRTEMDIDKILFEPNTSTFAEAFTIAATFPDYVQGWSNSDMLLSKFGLQTTPEGEFIVSQRAWDLIMKDRQSKGLYTYNRPREGDLIVMFNEQRWNSELPDRDKEIYHQNKNIFQITYVNKGKNNWQFGKDYVWRISASAYKYDEAETLTALTNEGDELFNTMNDFFKPDQMEDIKDEEKPLRVWDESHPFGDY